MRIGMDITVIGKQGGIPMYGLRLVEALLRLPTEHSFVFWSRSPGVARLLRGIANGRPVELLTAGRLRRAFGDFGEYGGVGFLSLARAGRPLDVVHGLNYAVPLRTAEAARVVTIHDLSVLHFPQWHTRRRVLLLGRALRRTAHRVERVITDCEAVRREVVEQFRLDPTRVVAVPHAAPACFKPLPPEALASRLAAHGLSHQGYLLYAGALEPRKNLLRLLGAYDALHSRRDVPPLILVGPPGWRNANIHARIRASAGRVRYLGYVPEDDLPALMAGAAAFVYVSLYEGFGLPALEALACGAPSVLSRIGALQEIAEGSAIFVDPRSEEQIADGLERALDDEALRSRLQSSGLARARLYSWERTARETLAVYERARAEAEPT